MTGGPGPRALKGTEGCTLKENHGSPVNSSYTE